MTNGNTLPLPAKIDELTAEVKRLKQEKAKLLIAAKAALVFMERVEAQEWVEGGPETQTAVEEFRAFLVDLEAAEA